MKECLRNKIKDPDVLWLADDVIDSMQGLPIGNYTSQHFGNLLPKQL
jgi:RNA-directed DNA polymerase